MIKLDDLSRRFILEYCFKTKVLFIPIFQDKLLFTLC